MIIECDVFRARGTWYCDEKVEIPQRTRFWDVPDMIRKNRHIPNMSYYGILPETGVPFFVPAERPAVKEFNTLINKYTNDIIRCTLNNDVDILSLQNGLISKLKSLVRDNDR